MEAQKEEEKKEEEYSPSQTSTTSAEISAVDAHVISLTYDRKMWKWNRKERIVKDTEWRP